MGICVKFITSRASLLLSLPCCLLLVLGGCSSFVLLCFCFFVFCFAFFAFLALCWIEEGTYTGSQCGVALRQAVSWLDKSWLLAAHWTGSFDEVCAIYVRGFGSSSRYKRADRLNSERKPLAFHSVGAVHWLFCHNF